METIICAAVKTAHGKIIRGHRHSDCFSAIHDRKLKPDKNYEAEGFITSKNIFVDRREGRKLQDEAGIISVAKDGYCGNVLYSEDLY